MLMINYAANYIYDYDGDGGGCQRVQAHWKLSTSSLAFTWRRFDIH